MSKSQKIFADFLHRAEADEPAPFGDVDDSSPQSAIRDNKTDHQQIPGGMENQRWLEASLHKSVKTSTAVATVLVLMYAAILVAGFWMAYYHRDHPRTFVALCGGSLLSLTGIVVGLQNVWREKYRMDTVAALLPSLSPTEAIKVVQSIYYDEKNRVSHRGRSGRRTRIPD